MSSIQSTHATAHAPDLPAGLVLLLAVGAGLAVASIYYSQPMLGVLATEIGASPATLGWMPTLTQLGYAMGILLLAPLGDRYDRRRVILVKAVALVVSLAWMALAPSIDHLLAASLAVGMAATLAQDIVPAAATLAPAQHRGRVIGTVMTGLLMGILLSRTVSGVVSQQFGWRAMFVAAALAVALLALVLWRGLPRFAPATTLPYRALLGSLVDLWRAHPALRRAALAQGLLSVGFSAFWSTLAVMLHGEPFHLGAAVAGAFGLAGAAGALAAPLAGRLADRRGPGSVARLGAGLVVVAFASMALALWLSPRAQLMLLVAGAVGFDLGIQAALIAHQTIVYGLDPAARSRLNAVLMTGVFIGMATGSALGSAALAHWGWSGVVSVAVVASLGALVLRLATPHRPMIHA